MSQTKKQFIVIGGELEFVDQDHYRDPSKVVFYGAFDDRNKARDKWKEMSMFNVDNAHFRVKIVDIC